MSVNVESLLEARLPNVRSLQLVRQLTNAMQAHQAVKSPFSRLYLPV
jgi:hypothetical protein